MQAETVIDRLSKHSHINFFTMCVEWNGCKNSDGYGSLNVNRKTPRVHRLSYEEHFVEIPKKLNVCHTCDNPACINPQHLFLGTQKENMRDCARKKRIFAPSGIASPNNKLSVEDVIKIRADTRLSSVIAKDFGIGNTQVAGIKNGTRGLYAPPSLAIPAQKNSGERNGGGGKLNAEQVKQIFVTDRSLSKLAKEHSVSTSTISAIKLRRKWRSVTEECASW